MRSTSGQAMTEYILLVVFVALATMVFTNGITVHDESVMPGFVDAIGDFYQRVTRIVSIPFP